ncbi:MAG: FAD binding domain-containing protein [Planctomycetes bacterium]|nr:FAD binding domain-containing protein [Planctomycetota bacterium]
MLRLPKFTLHRPTSAADAVRIAAGHGPEASYVAGGTDLYPNMKRRVQRPTHVVSLSRCADLRSRAGVAGAEVTLGAMTTLTAIERDPWLQEHYPAFVHAASVISTPLLRNMGTIGGNLLLDTRCNYYDQNYEWRESISFCMKCDGSTCWVAPSSPRCWAVQSSDTVPLLCAIGAHVTLLGPDGERRIPLTDLYRDDGIAYTTKRPGELLTHLHLPALNGWRASYRKLRRRGSFDFPVLGVGACLHFDGDVVTRAEVRIGGAGSHAIPAVKTAAMLVGQRLRRDDAASGELIRAAAQEAYKPTRAMDNTDLDAAWRKKMAPVFVSRAIQDCL